MNRAYSLLTIKSLNEQRRTIEGIATTPTPDRMNDIVVPEGARFKTPLPLQLHHDSRLPVGTVDFARPTKTGIPFKASLPVVAEPGVVQDRVNEALHSLKYRLLNAVSIGFQPINGAIEQLKSGGLKFLEWEWLELSLVSIPAQPEAVINTFKSLHLDQVRRLVDTARESEAVELDNSFQGITRELKAASGSLVYGPEELRRVSRRQGAVYIRA
jgi:hypothetical protein